MNYVIGVDSGGTKTEVIAYDSHGKELARALGGFGNIFIDREKAVENICYTVDKVRDSLESGDKCSKIYMGIGGIEGGKLKDDMEKLFTEKLTCPCELMNDSEIAIYALLKGQDGILLIAGTGSICFGKNNGKIGYTGGLGGLLGDEGSGYYISICAIKNIFEERDLGKEPGELSQAILTHYKLNSVDEVLAYVYGVGKTEIASAAPVVSKLASEGNAEAMDILKQAGRELGKITLRAYIKFGFNNERVYIGLIGSIIRHVAPVKNIYIEYLNDNNVLFELIQEEVSACKGAYYLALQEGLLKA